MGMKEEDLIRYLDAFMSGNGGSIKPVINKDGNMTFITAEELDVSNDDDDELKEAEAAFGERQESEHSLFNDDVDDECPTCANIPNIGDDDFDDFDDLW